MKYFTILFLSTLHFYGFSQNQKPIAGNDIYEYTYDQSNPGFAGDTHNLLFIYISLLQNDTDPEGLPLQIDSVWLNSTNFIESRYDQGHVSSFNYFIHHGFSGTDSIHYILSDSGTPKRFDTGLVIIKTQEPIHKSLQANHINARIDPFNLFGRPDSPGFEAPAGSHHTSIFSANLWVAGKKDTVVHSNIRTYGTQPGDRISSNPGPISNTSHLPHQLNPEWVKVWKVHQNNIDFHLTHYNDPNYSVISNIRDWPAHGDTSKGEPFYLAPFVDSDQDGLYHPQNGDYPQIKGDQAVYFIYNDGYSFLTGLPMKCEVHGMAYAFQCSDSAIQNTIFIDYNLINRSSNTYDSTYIGMWSDPDIGNAIDDYIQCDVSRNMYYVFNGDDFDNNNGGMLGYGNHPGAQAVLLLQGAQKDPDGIDNPKGVVSNQSINGKGFGDGIADNEHWGMTNFYNYYQNQNKPETDTSFYTLLSGKYSDGTGYFSQNGVTYNYLFPGDSDPYYYGSAGIPYSPFTEVTAGNTPDDRKGISSTGPVTFAPNDTIKLTYAFVFGRDYANTGAQAGIDNMLERVDSIQSYYDQGLLAPCGFPTSIIDKKAKTQSFVVYPNPTKDILNIQQEIGSKLQISIFDVTGKLLLTAHSSEKQIQINTNNLPNGLYVISIQSETGKSSQMFIKN